MGQKARPERTGFLAHPTNMYNPHSADIQADLISKEFRIFKASNHWLAII
jgi:hypothetical protein